jgi:hypothetical protein
VLAWIALGFSFFLVSDPSSSARRGGNIPSTGCMVPQLFAAGGNKSYPDFLVVTGDPWYPGYKTPTRFLCAFGT